MRAHSDGESDMALAPTGAQGSAVDELLADARSIEGFGLHPERTLPWVVRAGTAAPLPGTRTADLWRLLAETARIDVAAARMLEPHLDALAILAEARRDGVPLDLRMADAGGSWGVFAAEGGDDPVRAERQADGTWRLTGTKPWCSLAAQLDRALITAWVDDDRGLFAVDLRGPSVSTRPGPWVPRGLAQVVSAPIDLDRAPALPVGGPGWYLRRPGFAWGGMGVAAVWWGGAQPLADTLSARARIAGADQLAEVYAGEADAASWASSIALAAAARAVDDGVDGEPARLLAARVRAVVAGNVRAVLALEARALGPGPASVDETHARRVADLELYVRQDHADRDLARLGRLSGAAPESRESTR